MKFEDIKAGDQVLVPVHAENVQLKAENEKLKAGIKAVRDLIDDSYGVSGLHLNGSVANWASLQEGGHFEDWLLAFNEAEELASKPE